MYFTTFYSLSESKLRKEFTFIEMEILKLIDKDEKSSYKR